MALLQISAQELLQQEVGVLQLLHEKSLSLLERADLCLQLCHMLAARSCLMSNQLRGLVTWTDRRGGDGQEPGVCKLKVRLWHQEDADLPAGKKDLQKSSQEYNHSTEQLSDWFL
jgi:hypothetical protein